MQEGYQVKHAKNHPYAHTDWYKRYSRARKDTDWTRDINEYHRLKDTLSRAHSIALIEFLEEKMEKLRKKYPHHSFE